MPEPLPYFWVQEYKYIIFLIGARGIFLLDYQAIRLTIFFPPAPAGRRQSRKFRPPRRVDANRRRVNVTFLVVVKWNLT
jgi:hypothetical protein